MAPSSDKNRIHTKVAQVSNVSPSASRDQLYQMFGFFGKIEELKVYPSEYVIDFMLQHFDSIHSLVICSFISRTNPLFATFPSKLCYIKFSEADAVDAAQHMTNTVFIDRALVCVPVVEGNLDRCVPNITLVFTYLLVGKIPDEDLGLRTGGPALPGQKQLPPNVTTQIQIVENQQVCVSQLIVFRVISVIYFYHHHHHHDHLETFRLWLL